MSEITLLKIDTEGHDYAVIDGFSSMLESHVIKVIQFEYNHRWLPSGRSMRSIFDLAERYGYQVGRTDPAGVEVYAGWNAELDRFIEWNYVLLAPRHGRKTRRAAHTLEHRQHARNGLSSTRLGSISASNVLAPWPMPPFVVHRTAPVLAGRAARPDPPAPRPPASAA